MAVSEGGKTSDLVDRLEDGGFRANKVPLMDEGFNRFREGVEGFLPFQSGMDDS